MSNLTKLDNLKLSFINSAIDMLTIKLDASDGWEHEYEIDENRRDSLFVSDIDFEIFRTGKDFKAIEDFLNRNEINFITYIDDTTSQDDLMYLKDKSGIEIGYFYDEQVKSLRSKLEKIKSEILNPEAIKYNKIHVFYNEKLGVIIFDKEKNISITLVGKENDIFNSLIENKEDNSKVSWDIIQDDVLDKFETPTKNKKIISDAVNRINNKSKEYIEKNKKLIEKKRNEYWLNYYVTKSD